MSDTEKLLAFIEAALRHAGLPDNPGVESVSRIDGEDVLGVELADGKEFFIEVSLA